MDTDEHLANILRGAARDNGFCSIRACFGAFKDFSVRWKTCGTAIDVTISDYLDDAPEEVIAEFAVPLMNWVHGRKTVCGPTYMSWVTSDGFIVSKRKVYIRRSKNIARTYMGTAMDLTESADRLLNRGLIGPNDIDNSLFTWTARPNYHRVGYCSPMMRVVTISSALDNQNIPEYVLDYVVYHECLHLRQGYRPFGRVHDTDFRRQEKLFPEHDKAENFLRSL
jgi:hypothetical protein